jgi:two-component system nitrogen regulation response regulator GlnG
LRAESHVPADADWSAILRRDVEKALMRGEANVMDALARQFERVVISQALMHTGGRRIEAATLLGIGRNTITRKIADLAIDEPRG